MSSGVCQASHVVGGLPGFLFVGLRASLNDCLAGVSDSLRSPQTEMFPKWRTSIVCIKCNLWVYNVSTTNILSTLTPRMILHYLSGFSAEYIRWRSDHLMNLGLDREVTAVSRSVDGDPRTLFCEETDSC